MKTNFKHLTDNNEAAIIDCVLKHAMALGMTISVYDGEEWTVRRSRDADAIRDAVATTEITVFMFRCGQFQSKIGRMVFLHGNGEDVIHDFTWGPFGAEPMYDLWEHVKEECGL